MAEKEQDGIGQNGFDLETLQFFATQKCDADGVCYSLDFTGDFVSGAKLSMFTGGKEEKKLVFVASIVPEKLYPTKIADELLRQLVAPRGGLFTERVPLVLVKAFDELIGKALSTKN
ncbi:MAG: hypothetical protein WC449_01775 [Candidatus Paceibacterota bacterium]